MITLDERPPQIERPRPPGRLTNKQRAFIEEYLVDFNGTRAAERAGYGGDDITLAVTASRLLKTDKVAEKIAARFAAKIMTADEVLSRLSGMARADISEFITDTGAIDWEKVRKQGYLVKRIVHRRGKQSQIELHDAQSALQLIGKHLRLFIDRQEITGKDGKPIKVAPTDPTGEHAYQPITDAERLAALAAFYEQFSTEAAGRTDSGEH